MIIRILIVLSSWGLCGSASANCQVFEALVNKKFQFNSGSVHFPDMNMTLQFVSHDMELVKRAENVYQVWPCRITDTDDTGYLCRTGWILNIDEKLYAVNSDLKNLGEIGSCEGNELQITVDNRNWWWREAPRNWSSWTIKIDKNDVIFKKLIDIGDPFEFSYESKLSILPTPVAR